MKTVTFITGNPHKADYLSCMLDLPLKHRAVDLTEIQSTSLEEVVEHKVRQAYTIAKCPVLVEDVALGFTALGELPGSFIKFFVEAPNGLRISAGCLMVLTIDRQWRRVYLATTTASGSNCFVLNFMAPSLSIP